MKDSEEKTKELQEQMETLKTEMEENHSHPDKGGTSWSRFWL